MDNALFDDNDCNYKRLIYYVENRSDFIKSEYVQVELMNLKKITRYEHKII